MGRIRRDAGFLMGSGENNLAGCDLGKEEWQSRNFLPPFALFYRKDLQLLEIAVKDSGPFPGQGEGQGTQGVPSAILPERTLHT